MNKLILDHFYRWRRFWLIGGILCQALAFTAFLPHKDPFKNIFPLIIFLGSFLLSIDLQRGHPRALLAMPVTIRQIARAWWIVSVGIPSLALALMIAIAFICLSLFGHAPVAPEDAVMYWAMNTSLLGTMFFALTGLPTPRNYGAGLDRIRGIFFGALWGLSYGGWYFINSVLTIGAGSGLVLLAVFAVLTIAGWFNAENMVLERAGLRLRKLTGTKKSPPSRCAEGHGGLRYLSEALARRILFMSMMMFGMYFLMFYFMGFGKNMSTGKEDSFTLYIFSFQFLWIISFQAMPLILQIRHLRTLPVSALKLAAVLTCVPALGMFLILYLANLAVAQIFAMPVFSPLQMFSEGYFMQIAVVSVLVPLLVWRGMSVATYLGIIGVMIFGVFGATFFHNQISHVAGNLLGLVIFSGSVYATKWLLENSSTVYRSRNHQMAGWNWTVNR